MAGRQGAGEGTAPRPDPGWPVLSARRRFVELFALAGFVVVQPVLGAYGRASDVFVFRDISAPAVLAFTLAVVFVPPLAMWLVGSVAARFGPKAGTIVHVGSMFLLWVALWVEVLDHLGAAPVLSAAGGVLLGGGSTVLFSLRPAFRTWLSFASPAPLVFAVIFLTLTPVSGLVLSHGGPVASDVPVKAPAPVVMLVFDEFPLASLLGADGRIDADLFPNLGALAAGSDTYLNATSNSARTPYSVPSMLTGNLPDGQDVPTAATHPNSLFTLLGNSHDLRVHELLSMCTEPLCPRARDRGPFDGLGSLLYDGVVTLADIVDPRHQVAGVARGDALTAMRRRSGEGQQQDVGEAGLLLPDRYADFLDDLDRPDPQGRPLFGFFHILLPHAPWLLTPSGQRYSAPRGLPGVLDTDGEIAWDPQGTFIPLARQRHLLQVQYVDQLVGELVRRLEASGVWDDALVVLTADHGTAFEAGQSRRAPEGPAVGEVAWVPLFVKQPGQRTGSSSMANVQLVDVVPTVAEVLDVDLPWQVDGRSMLGTVRPLEARRPYLVDVGEVKQLDGVRLRPALSQRSAGVFAPRRGDPLRIFRAGPGDALVGQPVADVASGPPVTGSAQLARTGRYRSVDTAAAKLPIYLTGAVRGVPAGLTTVAVSVNGVVAGVSPLTGGAGERDFAVLLPPSLLRDGSNSLRVFAVDSADRLSPLPLR